MVSSKMLYGHNYSLYKPVQSLPQSSPSVNASHAVLHVARRFLLHLLGLSIPCSLEYMLLQMHSIVSHSYSLILSLEQQHPV